MSNNLMSFENQNVEVFELGGVIYFNPYHIGKCLELEGSAVRKAIGNMNEKQAVKLTNSDVNSSDIRKLNNAGELFLTESGVYKLIFKSRKPNAERFTDWVTDEVLPTIRKTGKYETDAFKNLSKELQAVIVVDKRVTAVEKRVENLENTSVSDYAQRKKLKQAGVSAVIKALGGKSSKAYKDNKIRTSAFTTMWHDFREFFELISYHDIPKTKLIEALDYLSNWEPPINLKRAILACNEGVA